MAYVTQTNGRTNSLSLRIHAAAQNIRNGFKRRQLARETFNGLSVLSNRELADLGIHRADIGRIARDAARDAQL